MERQEKVVRVWCDGSVDGRNNGSSVIGAGAVATGAAEFRISGRAGRGSNNTAEYRAVLYALRALSLDPDPGSLVVEMRTDSKLVVEQVNGRWQAADHLLALRDLVLKEAEQFAKFSIEHVRREQNQAADGLARSGLNKTLG